MSKDAIQTVTISAFINIPGEIIDPSWKLPEYLVVADTGMMYLMSDRRLDEVGKTIWEYINKPTEFIVNESKGLMWLTPIEFANSKIGHRPL